MLQQWFGSPPNSYSLSSPSVDVRFGFYTEHSVIEIDGWRGSRAGYLI
jgi:hypothetical protein